MIKIVEVIDTALAHADQLGAAIVFLFNSLFVPCEQVLCDQLRRRIRQIFARNPSIASCTLPLHPCSLPPSTVSCAAQAGAVNDFVRLLQTTWTLKRGFSSLTRSHANCLLQIQDKDLPVADLSRASHFGYRIDGPVQ